MWDYMFSVLKEKMFYQFSVEPQHRDLLRFLWWPEGDVTRRAEEYRMTVHVFGAASSPSVANFGLKKAARDRVATYPESVTRFIQKSFYVDDGLAAVSTVQEAVVIAKVVAICAKKRDWYCANITATSRPS